MGGKILIICGPTATGKTSFALEVARKYSGELVSADSRQVYTNLNIVTGKDLPPRAQPRISNLIWRDRKLKYYLISGVKVWLYDVVNPDEPFNVAYWRETAGLVLGDIKRRHKLPLVIGGTGLYIKSLISPLSQIAIPPQLALREKLVGKSASYLFNYLNRVNPQKAATLNISDRHNPRRLIRAIEISLSQTPSSHQKPTDYELLQICLTADRDFLYQQIDKRIASRLTVGATAEAQKLFAQYGSNLPSLTACGYRAFLSVDPFAKWRILEHQYDRRQLTWFKHQPDIRWFDISSSGWKRSAVALIDSWYNKNEHAD